MIKIAVIQTNATKDKMKSLSRAISLVVRAIERQATFILLPEVFAFRGKPDKREGLSFFAENIPGESTRSLMALARKHKVTILAGSVLERVKNTVKVYNTSVLINSRGEIKAKYRKINLFDARIGKKIIKESQQLLPGKKLAMPKVQGFNVGLSICYDLRFPEIYREYAKRGAHVLCVPSAFTKKTGVAHWEALLRARAIENMCYVLAPNQTGKDSRGIPSYGHSMIVSPWGEILARASGTREEIIFANLNMQKIKEGRRALPSIGRAVSVPF